MGASCSRADKEDEDPTESKAQVDNYSPTRRKLHKMPQIARPVTRSQSWRVAIGGRELETQAAYNNARAILQKAEKEEAFDVTALGTSSEIERNAADLLQKIQLYDWENVYAPPLDHSSTEKRAVGQHFLGNVDHINKTWLMQVSRRMPKGAHLHIHFNSCLPANFLIRQARNIDAMYIRSTLPLTTPENWAASRISFMVMTPHQATHARNVDDTEKYVPLGNVWDSEYVPNTWMEYKTFQRQFELRTSQGEPLKGTIGAETWLEQKMLISEEEAHGTHQTGRGIWEKFNHRTQMMKGLFAYESAFRNYTRACIEDFAKDNIQYAEIRPNFMSTNTLKKDDGVGSIGNEGIMQIIEEELQITKAKIKQEGGYFGDMKVIYCTPRSFKNDQIETALNECIELKQKFPDLLCGFDLVGHEEMGNELRQFVPEFLTFRQKCKALNLDIPFLFHCGETLDVGDKTDGNLFDAILLNSKRIGHGYALARHPFLMNIFKEKNIAVESCPISNEILGLTPTMAGHHLPILLANHVPCTINSDNATFYRSSLSHDFYQVMIGSESMTLLGWKQLIEWSLEHSCMSPKELSDVRFEWTTRWKDFCQWILDEYGPKLKNWEPAPGRH